MEKMSVIPHLSMTEVLHGLRDSHDGITANGHTLEVQQIKEPIVLLIFPASSVNSGILGVRILCYLVSNSSTSRGERLLKVSSPLCSKSGYNSKQRSKYLTCISV